MQRGPHYTRCELPNFANHALQIFGLEARRGDGMIRGGSALLKHSNVAPRFLRDARKHQQKVVATHAAGATAGKEDSAPYKQLHRGSIQSMVSHQRLICTPSASGKFGRIQDDRVELLPLGNEGIERLKSVRALEPDTFEIVDFGVAHCLRDGSLAAVDAEHFRRAA